MNCASEVFCFTGTRRAFLGGAASVLASIIPTCTCGGEPGRGVIRELVRDVPVRGDFDVIVAGGGPAGIAAAVTAARLGLRVLLVEGHGQLGGVWTSGFLACLIGFDSSEFDREILARLDKYGARSMRRPGRNEHSFVYEPEYMKLVCEEMCAEANVRVRLHTTAVGVFKDVSGRNLEAVITESKSGREAWRAKFFVDCTGDGDLGALAGCGFDIGGGSSGAAEQPASLIALVTLPDDRGILGCVANEKTNYDSEGECVRNPKDVLREELNRVGIHPSYGSPTLFRVHPHIYALMANHEYDIPVDDADAITNATIRARREIFVMTDALAKKGGDSWRGLRVLCSAEQLGHRRARRLHGRYTVTLEDCLAGRAFHDAIAICSFGLDVHAVSKEANKVKPAGSPVDEEVKPYQIPLRACRARDIDNLYMAGRCISGDFLPQASYRITGTAVALGAGVARAICRELKV